jgi:hypothetical protein
LRVKQRVSMGKMPAGLGEKKLSVSRVRDRKMRRYVVIRAQEKETKR